MRATLIALLLGCGARTGLFVGATEDASVDAPADTAPVGCKPGVITLDRARPAVMMVLDRSGSMGQRLSGTSNTRWQILTRALETTMPAVDTTMSLGALIFPAANSGSQSCVVPTAADIAPGLGNVSALITAMKSRGPGGATPTAPAIDAAAKVILAMRAASTARAMVLATDGAPDCNTALDPRTCRCASTTMSCAGRAYLCLDDLRTNKTLEDYASRGLPTYVIGIAAGTTGAFPDVLDTMAVAGGRPKPDGAHRFYGADSEEELDAALIAIRDQVGACTYLTVSVPDEAGTFTLLIDGRPVAEDRANGWQWSDKPNGQIALFGAACAAATATAVKIEARVECSDGG